MNRSGVRSWLKVVFALLVVVACSWLLFGPIYAFHHDVGYGLLGYMFSGGEDADPGDFVLFGERFWVFPGRLAVTLAVWIGVVAIVIFVIRH